MQEECARLGFARGVSRRNFSGAMSTPAAIAIRTAPQCFKRATARETAVLLAVAWLVPFAVHLAPWSGVRPLGAYVLPMFWTTLVASYFFGARVGVIVGVFAPIINLLVTGLPALAFAATMSVELAVFAVAVAAGVRRWPRFVLIAPAAYVAGRLASTALLGATGAFADFDAAVGFVTRALSGGVAGLVVLSALHAALVWFYPKSGHASAE